MIGQKFEVGCRKEPFFILVIGCRSLTPNSDCISTWRVFVIVEVVDVPKIKVNGSIVIPGVRYYCTSVLVSC